jgi:hypothetical protein
MPDRRMRLLGCCLRGGVRAVSVEAIERGEGLAL